MQGSLADVSPAELCLRLAGQAATGALRLASPQGEASLRLHHGTLVSARAPTTSGTRGARLGERLVHAGRLDRADLDRILEDQRDADDPPSLGTLLVDAGLVPPDLLRLFLLEQLLESLLETVGWVDGAFDFTPSPAPNADGTVELAVPVDRALMEVRRRVAEADRIRQLVPSRAMVPRVVDGAPLTTNVSADTFTVLSSVDGHRSVDDIASMLGYSVSEVSRIVYGLMLQGRLEAADEHSRGPEPPTLSLRDDFEPQVATTDRIDLLDTPAPTSSVGAELLSPANNEPEPWVGYANAGGDDAAPAAPAASTSTDQAAIRTAPAQPAPAPRPADPRPDPLPDPLPASTRQAAYSPASHEGLAASQAQSRSLDDATRRALFSELHDVSASRPAPREAPPEPPAAPPAATPDPSVDEAALAEEAEEPELPTQRPAGLSGSEVSELLAELHALNLDDT